MNFPSSYVNLFRPYVNFLREHFHSYVNLFWDYSIITQCPALVLPSRIKTPFFCKSARSRHIVQGTTDKTSDIWSPVINVFFLISPSISCCLLVSCTSDKLLTELMTSPVTFTVTFTVTFSITFSVTFSVTLIDVNLRSGLGTFPILFHVFPELFTELFSVTDSCCHRKVTLSISPRPVMPCGVLPAYLLPFCKLQLPWDCHNSG